MNKTNEDWINSLKSKDLLTRDTAILELHMLLLRGLNGAFKSNACATPSIIEDSAQEALLRITVNLDSFRSESKFFTWVMKIAIRIVYSEMRKAGWKDVSIDEASKTTKFNPLKLVSKAISPEEQTMQTLIINKLWEAINESLTVKQRKAVIADFVKGMPIEEIARKMNTNRNAIYKLLYDARQNLKKHLISSDVTLEEIKTVFDI